MNKNDLLLVQAEPSVYNMTIGTTTYSSTTYYGFRSYALSGVAAFGSISYPKFKGNTIVYLNSYASGKIALTSLGISGPTGYQKITVTRLDTGAQLAFEATSAHAGPSYF